MPRGGARPGTGPAPAEHSQKKDRAAKRAAKGLAVIDDGEWLVLPREGRSSNAPAWPLSTASKREQLVWRREWKRPQALGWERTGISVDQVAVYVRTLVRAEEPDSAIGLLNLVRMQQDGLGLSAVGMRMLRWKIGQVKKATTGEPGAPAAPRPVPGVSPKERLKLVRDVG